MDSEKIDERENPYGIYKDTDKKCDDIKDDKSAHQRKISKKSPKACVGSVFPIPCMSLQVANLIKGLFAL